VTPERTPSSGPQKHATTRPDLEATKGAESAGRFDRGDGRFDLPVVIGRTPKQVARRLA
jgi:hypothetical protein